MSHLLDRAVCPEQAIEIAPERPGPAWHTVGVSSPRAGGLLRRVPIGAAVDIGAYSVHLLVAEVHGHRLEPLADVSEPLRLGETVDARGELGFEAGFRLLETLEAYVAAAARHGATAIALVATDPLRRAGDAEPVIAAVTARTGAEIQVLEHHEEAYLALLGVHAGRPVLRETAIVDVGGGSTEILLVGPGRPPVAAGLALGAARLTRMLVKHDPPTPDEITSLLDEARSILAGAPDGWPVDLIAVGGTASNLLRVGSPLARHVLTVQRIARTLELLTAAPAEVISTQFSVKPSRARVLPGGASILLAVAERYGRDRVRVASGGIREGLVLAAVHAGSRWRAELSSLVNGWSR